MREIKLEKIDSEKIAKNKKGYREDGTGRSERVAIKNAVGYLRVSTAGQSGDGTYGLDMQKAAIQKYAEEHGYQVVEWYEEIGSGAKNRPIFDEIAYGGVVANPPYEAVIVYKSDRVARDMKLYFAYLFALERKGVELLSTIEDFEDEGIANIYRALLQFVAEQERKNICVRTSAGKRQKRQDGGYIGGRTAYGYMVVDSEYAIEKSEAEVVKRIFALHSIGKSYRYISEKLWEEGHLARNGKPFNHNTICSIISNRQLYEGKVKFNGEWIPGRHEAIL